MGNEEWMRGYLEKRGSRREREKKNATFIKITINEMLNIPKAKLILAATQTKFVECYLGIQKIKSNTINFFFFIILKERKCYITKKREENKQNKKWCVNNFFEKTTQGRTE